MDFLEVFKGAQRIECISVLVSNSQRPTNTVDILGNKLSPTYVQSWLKDTVIRDSFLAEESSLSTKNGGVMMEASRTVTHLGVE